ncbi:MAG: hypothetical protein LBQ24_04240 [Candidatus Peribacteria bacterium]|nr:hypothetical protein [Candidatus Peribacteria bacterium]
MFLKSIIIFLTLLLDFKSVKAFSNSFATHCPNVFIFIRKVLEFKSFVSKLFTIIFSLVILSSSFSQSLNTVKITSVQAGHFIQEVTSLRELFFVTSLESTFKITSHHFTPAFSAGLEGIGFTILGIQGLIIST